MSTFLREQDDYNEQTFAGLACSQESLTDITFHECTFKECTFAEAVFNDSSFLDCEFYDCDLSMAVVANGRFHNVAFHDSRLIDTLFRHTNLTQADFTNAKNYAISPTINTLKKTKYSMPEAMALLHGLDIILDDLTQR